MAQPVAAKKITLAPVLIGVVAVVIIFAASLYLSRPAKSRAEASPSGEAKAYLPHLVLSDVSMEASENFMKQQVIEVKGKISDTGDRAIQSVEVYCLFYGVDGKEIHRERLPIVRSKGGAPLQPGETRPFRLPFDAVPEGWNQTIPRMAIAQVSFAH